MIEHKITSTHTSKQAYIYLRQSTMEQVRFHQESTERQYALKDKALHMGWKPELITILDGDLGLSGTQITTRKDFQTLVSDVSMKKVGAVFALEASRLSRSCTDWHRLLELCALTETLIIDEDGCYNPANFNDQLLLGLKGTMSQAELHFIRARLQGGKLNKAKKGELKLPLPIGFCYDEHKKITYDPDEQIRHVISLFFRVFQETGSAYGVMQYFGQNKILFPKRMYLGEGSGQLTWGSLSHTRALSVLHNPTYAGAYVFGRHYPQKTISEQGNVHIQQRLRSISECPVVIHAHHEGYISWETFENNQQKLRQNHTNISQNRVSAAAREGQGLLQGLLLCGQCGNRLSIHYKKNKNGVSPFYNCHSAKKIGQSRTACFAVSGRALDEIISQKVLEIMTPFHLDIALKAIEELEQRQTILDQQWQMKIKRAEYEAGLTQRRYEEVDPSNRLVALTLEKNWNHALQTVEEIHRDYQEYKKKNVSIDTQKNREQIISLAQDLPRIWNAPSTNPKDRKRILRLLIKDITVDKIKRDSKAILHIRWQGGALEDIEVLLSRRSSEYWKHSEDIIQRVKELSHTLTCEEIAKVFNQEGLKSNKGNQFTQKSIHWIRVRYCKDIKFNSKSYSFINQLKKENELTIQEVMKKFNVSYHVVCYWIQHKMVEARKLGAKMWVVKIDKQKEETLKQKIEDSTKISITRKKIPK